MLGFDKHNYMDFEVTKDKKVDHLQEFILAGRLTPLCRFSCCLWFIKFAPLRWEKMCCLALQQWFWIRKPEIILTRDYDCFLVGNETMWQWWNVTMRNVTMMKYSKTTARRIPSSSYDILKWTTLVLFLTMPYWRKRALSYSYVS